MKKFVLLYHGRIERTPEVMDAWQRWFEKVGERFVDSGNPLGSCLEVTATGSHEISPDEGAATGYSIISAESRDEVDAMRTAMASSIHHFLAQLPEAYREPVRLAELEGLPLAKIALRMNLSLTAVKSRVRRGRQMLKAKLQACCRFEFDRLGHVIGWERRHLLCCE